MVKTVVKREAKVPKRKMTGVLQRVRPPRRYYPMVIPEGDFENPDILQLWGDLQKDNNEKRKAARAISRHVSAGGMICPHPNCGVRGYPGNGSIPMELKHMMDTAAATKALPVDSNYGEVLIPRYCRATKMVDFTFFKRKIIRDLLEGSYRFSCHLIEKLFAATVYSIYRCHGCGDTYRLPWPVCPQDMAKYAAIILPTVGDVKVAGGLDTIRSSYFSFPFDTRFKGPCEAPNRTVVREISVRRRPKSPPSSEIAEEVDETNEGMSGSSGRKKKPLDDRTREVNYSSDNDDPFLKRVRITTTWESLRHRNTTWMDPKRRAAVDETSTAKAEGAEDDDDERCSSPEYPLLDYSTVTEELKAEEERQKERDDKEGNNFHQNDWHPTGGNHPYDHQGQKGEEEVPLAPFFPADHSYPPNGSIGSCLLSNPPPSGWGPSHHDPLSYNRFHQNDWHPTGGNHPYDHQGQKDEEEVPLAPLFPADHSYPPNGSIGSCLLSNPPPPGWGPSHHDPLSYNRFHQNDWHPTGGNHPYDHQGQKDEEEVPLAPLFPDHSYPPNGSIGSCLLSNPPPTGWGPNNDHLSYNHTDHPIQQQGWYPAGGNQGWYPAGGNQPHYPYQYY